MALSVSYSRSSLLFGEEDFILERGAVVAQSDLFAGNFTVTMAAGSLLHGSLRSDRTTRELGPGYLGALGLSWRVLDDEGDLPYVVLSTSLGGLRADIDEEVEPAGYLALDFRFGATVGKTLAGWFSPYASLRVFGGPIFWQDGDELRGGTDKFHFQGAVGSVFVLPSVIDLFVEVEPGAEMGAIAGFGARY